MDQHHPGHRIRKPQADQGDLDPHGKHGPGHQKRQKGAEPDQGTAWKAVVFCGPGSHDAHCRAENGHGEGQEDAAGQKPGKAGRAGQELLYSAERVGFRQKSRPGPAAGHAPQQHQRHGEEDAEQGGGKDQPHETMFFHWILPIFLLTRSMTAL